MNCRTKFKRITIINFIEEFKEFKDDMNKYFITLQEMPERSQETQ